LNTVLACLHAKKEVTFLEGRLLSSQSEQFKQLWLAGKNSLQKAISILNMQPATSLCTIRKFFTKFSGKKSKKQPENSEMDNS